MTSEREITALDGSRRLQLHDLGCRCYPHVSEQDAITSIVEVARLEYLAGSGVPSVIRNLVEEQAEDEGLWFIAQTAPEAYLQQELRRLHAAIENDKSAPPVKEKVGGMGHVR